MLRGHTTYCLSVSVAMLNLIRPYFQAMAHYSQCLPFGRRMTLLPAMRCKFRIFNERFRNRGGSTNRPFNPI